MNGGMSVLFLFFFLLVGELREISLCHSPDCPGTLYVDKANLRLMEIHLPLTPKCWDYRYLLSHPACFISYFRKSSYFIWTSGLRIKYWPTELRKKFGNRTYHKKYKEHMDSNSDEVAYP